MAQEGEGTVERSYRRQTTHRQFVRLGASPDKILAFANRHGFLGKGLVLIDPDVPAGQFQQGQRGESLDFWKEHIRTLGYLVGLWDLIQRSALTTLRQIVRWNGPGEVRIIVAGKGGTLDEALIKLMRRGPRLTDQQRRGNDPAAREYRKWSEVLQESQGAAVFGEDRLLALRKPPYRAELLDRWKEGDALGPAQYYLADRLNERLSGSAIAIDPLADLQFRIRPSTLIDLMYLLLAIEVSGGDGKVKRECDRPGCMNEFDPVNPRQRYCEPRCRSLAGYYRKKLQGGPVDLDL